MTETTPLNPLRLPLFGERLIEASAGTGKTFTLVALYLRLLLGLGGELAFPRPLTVDELLVVTFTEAATEELRGRIRANIHALRIACVRGYSDDVLYLQLLEEIDDNVQAAKTLMLAERQMDEAAIFTIHGFCQSMLNLNAFESGMPFELRLIEDESLLRYQACADFWRRHCYPLPRAIAQTIGEYWSGPEALLRDINAWINGEVPRIKTPPLKDETIVSRHEKLVAMIDGVKAQWRQAQPGLDEIIENSGINRQRFNRKNQSRYMDKVNAWAAAETTSYTLPDALEKFAQHFLDSRVKAGGEPPRYPIFTAIDELLAQSLTLRDVVLVRAMKEIRYAVVQEKRRRGELGFDDMLSRLDGALRQPGGEVLARAIRTRFPVAMIDEFQDTDPQQYRIFHRIWHGQPELAMLLIGDPKQAIYAFRGADIFTYMRARREVSAHYTLDTNWRSSPAMVDSVNRLFTRMENPFLFCDIPFLPVNASPKNDALRFTCNGQEQPAMAFWLMEGEGVGVSDYQQYMARLCARQIRNWLNAGLHGEAMLWRGDSATPVAASDMTVLVRSRQEALLIRDALSALNIPSVYLSNRDSVFRTTEALELMWLLQAVLAPEIENTLRSAIATSMLGLNARDIDELNQNERAWDELVDEFNGYRQIWQKRGVMPMLRALIAHRKVAENLLATSGGERCLTDILHLSELLQQASAQTDSEHALVRWLAQHIAEPNANASSQQLRLESDKHLVQIVTIHKSKGLEYSLVWLPFIANYRVQNRAFYHDRTTCEAILDLEEDEQSLELAEAERLAEDLRLLYVALTRSVWHCSIGIAPLFRGNVTKKGPTHLHHSAIGRLIQQGEALDAAQLRACLESFCHGPIALMQSYQEDDRPWESPAQDVTVLNARVLTHSIRDDWRVTSYSGLQHHGADRAQDFMLKLDLDAVGETQSEEASALSAHQFPRGASPGTFLHGLFEALNFTQPVNPEWVAEQLQRGGFDKCWQPVLTHWINAILRAPINDPRFSLSQLDKKQKQVELEFYIPIDVTLQPQALDTLIRRYDSLSAGCSPLQFQQVRGMLKGFIDLVFCWQGRYYLLDYKSNWLGDSQDAYTREAMAQAMRRHRYDLQYQLYTLALHRYLRHRMADYDYDRHFGGVIYLFLRGVGEDGSDRGIFTTRPVRELIEQMDALFAGKIQEKAS